MIAHYPKIMTNKDQGRNNNKSANSATDVRLSKRRKGTFESGRTTIRRNRSPIRVESVRVQLNPCMPSVVSLLITFVIALLPSFSLVYFPHIVRLRSALTEVGGALLPGQKEAPIRSKKPAPIWNCIRVTAYDLQPKIHWPARGNRAPTFSNNS